MKEVNLNIELANLLARHGINVHLTEEFIETNLPDKVKFKARSVYTEVDANINSRLDVTAVTNRGEEIVESCGDIADSVEKAIESNFQNFCDSSLHPMLAALDCFDPHTYEQITFEEWEINGKVWKVYIGNLIPKIYSSQHDKVYIPSEFFDSVEKAIKSQKLTNRLHWFRAYYSQYENEISTREFLMDNQLLDNTDDIFKNIPVIPKVKFFSCRLFITLRDSSIV